MGIVCLVLRRIFWSSVGLHLDSKLLLLYNINWIS